jgi:asparagine synthase (glutamine-hydrolysing)
VRETIGRTLQGLGRDDDAEPQLRKTLELRRANLPATDPDVSASMSNLGLLLQAKGDRAAMHSSVETRYPFLDEDVFDYLAPLHPRWKLRGLRRDKYLLRLVAERWLPRDVAWRSKVVFRAPAESIFPEPAPKFVEQLLSPESLRKTGYFDPEVVGRWRQSANGGKLGVASGLFMRMGLAGVVSTQLWHHLFVDATLADLPSRVTTSHYSKQLVA